MEDGKYVDGSLWFYAPNKIAPAIFAAAFLISGLIHAWQCIHYKCWKVTGILPWASTIFVVGYILREIGTFHFDNLNIYISSIVFIYAAPPLYELSNYLILSRILYYIPHLSPIHPGRVLSTFAFLSSAVESLNANGAAYIANSSLTQSKQDLGKALLKAALILQLAILGAFVLLAIKFHKRCKKAGLLPANLDAVLKTLYASSALIGIRTIYRTVEYFSISQINFTSNLDPNTFTPLLRYEWYFWIFEASLMIINSVMLNARHPLRFLPRDVKVHLAEDGVTEVLGQGYKDRRAWWITVVDPFDVVGMVRGKKGGEGERFWEGNGGEAGKVRATA